MFKSPSEALRIELEEVGDAIVLDREKRIVWTGLFARAFLHLTLATAFEEFPDDDEEHADNPQTVDASLQMQLLEWLDYRFKDASNVAHVKCK